jgi:hypothetical protein
VSRHGGPRVWCGAPAGAAAAAAFAIDEDEDEDGDNDGEDTIVFLRNRK